MQAFLKIIAGKNRLSQRLAVAHGNQVQAIKRFLFRVTPEDHRFCRLMVDLPISERNDYDLKTQSFRLMDREDADRVLPVRRGNRFPATRFVPPFQETVQVRALFLGIFGDHIQKSLDKYLLIFGKIGGKKAEQTFRYFIEGLPGKNLQSRGDFRRKSRSFHAEYPLQHLIRI